MRQRSDDAAERRGETERLIAEALSQATGVYGVSVGCREPDGGQ